MPAISQRRDLPYELWHQCLKFAISNSADGPLPYLDVSTHWRDTIIQSPALWTLIVIDGGHDELARVHTFLVLSAGHLLDLVISFKRPRQNVEPALRLALTDASRIRSIKTITHKIKVTISNLFMILLQPPAFTQLEELDLDWLWLGIDRMSDLLSRCPNLRVMGHYPVHYESPIPEKVAQFTFNNLTLKDNYAFMQQRRVESLNLGYRGHLLHEEALLEVPIQGDTHTMEYLGVQHMRNLTKGVGQQLQHLVITLEFTLATQFVPFISSLINLRDLSMAILFETGKTRKAISFHKLLAEDMKNLRTCTLSICSRSIEPQFEDAEGFFRIFTDYRALEHLDVLNLNSEQYPLSYECLSSIIRSVANVHSLGINILQPSQYLSFANGQALELPRLMNISVKPGELLDCLPIKALNLVQMNIQGTSSSPEYVCCQSKLNYVECSAPETIRTIAQSSSAQYVETMTIRCASTSKYISTFPHIHTLEFFFDEDEAYRGHGIDELLLELLRQPNALPCLRILRTDLPPFWELLFEFFRRRNTSKVSKLATLTLPILPAFPILYRLVAFLQGQSNIYTTRDFDDVIFRRLSSHQSWRSCYCLQAGHIYCIDGSSTFSPEEIANLELLDLVHMDLAASTEDFQIGDLDHWEMLLRKEKRPKANCYGGVGNLIDITEYTLQE